MAKTNDPNRLIKGHVGTPNGEIWKNQRRNKGGYWVQTSYLCSGELLGFHQCRHSRKVANRTEEQSKVSMESKGQ